MPYRVVLVALISFGSHSEGLASAELETLIIPDFRNAVAQDCEEVVGHMQIIKRRAQIPQEVQEPLRL